MYEICLLIILSAGGARLPLSRSRALGAPLPSTPPPFYLPVVVMPLDQTRACSPVSKYPREINRGRCYDV